MNAVKFLNQEMEHTRFTYHIDEFEARRDSVVPVANLELQMSEGDYSLGGTVSVRLDEHGASINWRSGSGHSTVAEARLVSQLLRFAANISERWEAKLGIH